MIFDEGCQGRRVRVGRLVEAGFEYRDLSSVAGRRVRGRDELLGYAGELGAVVGVALAGQPLSTDRRPRQVLGEVRVVLFADGSWAPYLAEELDELLS